MQAVIPRPDVAPKLQSDYIALAGDADEPEAEVHQLLFKLKNASMLPIVILADAEGNFLTGAAGSIDAERLGKLFGQADEAAG